MQTDDFFPYADNPHGGWWVRVGLACQRVCSLNGHFTSLNSRALSRRPSLPLFPALRAPTTRAYPSPLLVVGPSPINHPLPLACIVQGTGRGISPAAPP